MIDVSDISAFNKVEKEEIPFRHQILVGWYEIASLIQIDLANFIRGLTDHEADILGWERLQNITI